MAVPKQKKRVSGSRLAKPKQSRKPAIKLHQPLEGDSAPELQQVAVDLKNKNGPDGNTVPFDEYDGRKYFHNEKVPLLELRPSNPHYCPDRSW